MSILVEISEEQCKKYFIEFRLCKKYANHASYRYYIFPKCNEMLKYWKYRKQFANYRLTSSVKEKLFFDTEEQFKNLVFEKIPYAIECALIFEFPDEETAFYFKMKFC